LLVVTSFLLLLQIRAWSLELGAWKSKLSDNHERRFFFFFFLVLSFLLFVFFC
jgi:hypothetical protein